MDFETTFYSIANSSAFAVTNPKAVAFLELLKRHGEVMIRSASAETWGIHLGDNGDITESCIYFKDGGNITRIIIWDQVEQFWAHKAHNE